MMRKQLFLFIVTLSLPLSAFAQSNLAISKPKRTYVNDQNDARLNIPVDVIAPASQATPPSYTISAWVNINDVYSLPTDGTGKSAIMGYGAGDHNNQNGCWDLCINNDKKFQITGWGAQSSSITGVITESTPIFNEWVYLTVAVSNTSTTSTFSVYQNGALLSQKNFKNYLSWFSNESPTFYVAGFGFIGSVDEVHFWNRYLNATEVKKAHDEQVISGFVGRYTFNNQGSTFSNTITSGQDATWLKYTGNAQYDGIYPVTNKTSLTPSFVEGRTITAGLEEITTDTQLHYNNGHILTNATGEIAIYNVTGKLVKSTSGASVSVTDLPQGIYIVKANGKTLKFIK